MSENEELQDVTPIENHSEEADGAVAPDSAETDASGVQEASSGSPASDPPAATVVPTTTSTRKTDEPLVKTGLLVYITPSANHGLSFEGEKQAVVSPPTTTLPDHYRWLEEALEGLQECDHVEVAVQAKAPPEIGDRLMGVRRGKRFVSTKTKDWSDWSAWSEQKPEPMGGLGEFIVWARKEMEKEDEQNARFNYILVVLGDLLDDEDTDRREAFEHRSEHEPALAQWLGPIGDELESEQSPDSTDSMGNHRDGYGTKVGPRSIGTKIGFRDGYGTKVGFRDGYSTKIGIRDGYGTKVGPRAQELVSTGHGLDRAPDTQSPTFDGVIELLKERRRKEASGKRTKAALPLRSLQDSQDIEVRPSARIRGTEPEARVFARAVLLYHELNIAFYGSRISPPVDMLVMDEPLLSRLEVLRQLGSIVPNFLTLPVAPPVPGGPLAGIAQWLMDPHKNWDTKEELINKHTSGFAKLLEDHANEIVTALERGADGKSTSDLQHKRTTAARSLLCLDDMSKRGVEAGLVNWHEVDSMTEAVEQLSEQITRQFEAASTKERQQIYERLVGGFSSGAWTQSVDRLARIVLTSDEEPWGWSPNAKTRQAAEELIEVTEGLRSGTKPHEGTDAEQSPVEKVAEEMGRRAIRSTADDECAPVTIYLPADAHVKFPPKLVGFDILRQHRGDWRPSGLTRLLGALRSASTPSPNEAEAQTQAEVIERMNADVALFWSRRKRKGPSKSSKREFNALLTRRQWVYLCIGADEDVELGGDERYVFEMKTYETLANELSEEPKTLGKLLLSSAKRVRTRRLVLAVSGTSNIYGDSRDRFTLLHELESDNGSKGIHLGEFVSTVRDALDELDHDKIDVLILDMPQIETLECLHELRTIAHTLVCRGTDNRPIDLTRASDIIQEKSNPGSQWVKELVDQVDEAKFRGFTEVRESFEGDLRMRMADAIAGREGKSNTEGRRSTYRLDTVDEVTRQFDLMCRLLFNHLDDEILWEMLGEWRPEGKTGLLGSLGLLDQVERIRALLICSMVTREMKAERGGIFFDMRDDLPEVWKFTATILHWADGRPPTENETEQFIRSMLWATISNMNTLDSLHEKAKATSEDPHEKWRRHLTKSIKSYTETIQERRRTSLQGPRPNRLPDPEDAISDEDIEEGIEHLYGSMLELQESLREILNDRQQYLDIWEVLSESPTPACRVLCAANGVVDALNKMNTSSGSPSLENLKICLPMDYETQNDPRYLALSFHQQVHLYALLSSVRVLRNKKKHELWSMIAVAIRHATGTARREVIRSLLDSDGARSSQPLGQPSLQGKSKGNEEGRSGPSRALLSSQSSLVQQDRGHAHAQQLQFASLATPPTLTLMLERYDKPGASDERSVPRDENGGARRYRLRLSSSASDAALPQNECWVNTQSIDEALDGFETILARAKGFPAHWRYLESLGEGLGEDIIHRLKDDLLRLRRDIEPESPGTEDHKHVHLNLRLSTELMRYPWELMSDSKGLLAERYAMGRQVWTDVGRARAVSNRTGPLRALIVGDPRLRDEPELELPGARKEAEQVAEIFERLAGEVGVSTVDFDRQRDVFVGATLTRSAMRRLLRDEQYDIVHFAGHGRFDRENPNGSSWRLSDGLLTAWDLRNTLAWTESPPWLIYANACESGMSGEDLTKFYNGDVYGMAAACIDEGTRNYIAPMWWVGDDTAKRLATGFYEALVVERATVGSALLKARKAAKKAAEARPGHDGMHDISWAGMVLYGDPTDRWQHVLG